MAAAASKTAWANPAHVVDPDPAMWNTPRKLTSLGWASRLRQTETIPSAMSNALVGDPS
jgi:hypothetical protein